MLHAPATAVAQRPSIRCYGVSDGLAHSAVRSIFQDAKGYLWIATSEGLSRFDGYRFSNYGRREGLGHAVTNDVTQDRQGRIWVATNGAGVALFLDHPEQSGRRSPTLSAEPSRFVNHNVGTSLESNRVNELLFDSAGTLWCVTDGGLFRGDVDLRGTLAFTLVVPHKRVTEAMAAFADSRGRLWFGVADDLIEVVGGTIIKYGPGDDVGRFPIRCVTEDRRGRLVVANDHSVFEFVAPPDPSARGSWNQVKLALDSLQTINAMISDPDGTLWIATTNGLVRSRDGREARYTSAQGLSDNDITALLRDTGGNLWIGTFGGGICRIADEMIVSITRSEGLPDQKVHQIVVDQGGRVYAATDRAGMVEVTEGRIPSIRSLGGPRFTWIRNQILQDRRDDWWLGSDRGLIRISGPDLKMDRGEWVTQADGIPPVGVATLCEGPQGDLWVVQNDLNFYHGTPSKNGRLRFERVPTGNAWPSEKLPTLTMVDRAGSLWVGAQGALARMIQGKVSMFQADRGLPETDPRAFYQDSRGWLWIGLRFKGVAMTKDPTAVHPDFVTYSTENGVASDTVWSISEDNAGRIYFGTGKGLDRLDPVSGRIQHFSSADGLAGDRIICSRRDRQGNIWIGTTTGISKFDPRAERVSAHPPPVYVSRIQVAGDDLRLAETGERHVRQFEFRPSQNNLLIEYVGLHFGRERELRYRYMLEGADAGWSSPSYQRSVNYARLSPGSYRFLVKAANQDGLESAEPAVFPFLILPPIWTRWWFMAMAATLFAALAYSLYRYRLTRLIQLERVRTRIATDLHDDIGSDLSLIAMVSEVARSRVAPNEAQLREWLSLISSTSRELVDSMSDIVWAVNPLHDRLEDMTTRMRRFAEDTLGPRNITLRFPTPNLEQDVKLGPDIRREIFLIFKEGINNILRHSACRECCILFQTGRGRLELELADDGVGFDPVRADGGNGLISMQKRAAELGGTLKIDSRPGGGTTLKLRISTKKPGLLSDAR